MEPKDLVRRRNFIRYRVTREGRQQQRDGGGGEDNPG